MEDLPIIIVMFICFGWLTAIGIYVYFKFGAQKENKSTKI